MFALGTAAVGGLVTAPVTVDARSYTSVRIEGTKFIPADQVKATCGISAGVDYSDEDLGAMEKCLRNTGAFSDATVQADGDALVVSVKEVPMRPGHVDFGLAYDSEDGIVGSIYFERYNLFPNTFGSIDLRASREMQSLGTSLYYTGTEPGKLDVGVDGNLLYTSYDDQHFDHSRAQMEAFLAHVDDRLGRFEGGLGYRRDRMSDVDADANALIKAEAGTVSAPYLRFSYIVGSDAAASTLAEPGYSIRVDQYFWDLAGSNAIADSRITARSSFPLPAESVLTIGFRAGALTRQGSEDTRTVDRYELGGADFRGFAPRGLGPKGGSDFLGGNYFAVSSIEVQHSVGTVLKVPARIGAFVDTGSVWGLDDTLGNTIDDSFHMRTSVGVAMTFDINHSPLSLYVAKAVDKQSGDKTQGFGMSFSTRF